LFSLGYGIADHHVGEFADGLASGFFNPFGGATCKFASCLVCRRSVHVENDAPSISPGDADESGDTRTLIISSSMETSAISAEQPIVSAITASRELINGWMSSIFMMDDSCYSRRFDSFVV